METVRVTSSYSGDDMPSLDLLVGDVPAASPLLLWALAGHSLLNAAVYVGDAQARNLPLLFGMNSSHHDWWNILSMTNLLDYDWLAALLTRILGVGVIVACALAGSYLAWVRPRTGVGKLPR